jgi:hypothetical protein
MPTKNNDHYLGNPLIKAANTPVEFTPEQIEEYLKCSTDPIYFIETYIKIVQVDRGLIPFDMYDFQRNIVRTIHDNRFTICKLPRQSGKSTTMISYLLHHILFNQDKKVAILANKLTTARELLQRLKKSYENLPKWLQQGIVEWNKLSIHLENGSKVIASSTSSSAVRGDTYSCVSGDSIITLRDSNGKIWQTTIGELYSNSSKNTNNYKYLHENDKKQIQEVVFFSDEKMFFEKSSKGNIHREASYSSSFLGWEEHSKKFCEIDRKRTHISTSFIDSFFGRHGASQDESCLLQDDERETRKIFKNDFKVNKRMRKRILKSEKCYNEREKTLSSSYRKYENSTTTPSQERNIYVGKFPNANKFSKQRSFTWNKETQGIWGEDISFSEGKKKNQRTCGEDKQKSRKNIKNGRETSWDEKVRGSKIKNEISCFEKIGKKWWSLEQGIENGRPQIHRGEEENERIGEEKSAERWSSDEKSYEVLTSKGFKKFLGISKTFNRDTICLLFENGVELRCTPDHLIHTNGGFKEARTLTEDDIVHTNNSFTKLVKILPSSKMNVYDLLEVEDVHSFYANEVDVHNCILLDEFAFVPNNIAEDFFNSVYPTISSGESTKVVIVSTPKGMNMFYKMWKNAENEKNSYVPIEVHWNEIPGRDQKFKEETIRNTSERQWMQEFECAFLGSEDTLISSAKLATMVFEDPVRSAADGLDIFEEPKKDNVYIMCVDTCRAQGADYHAFSVIDVTQMPYRMVAKYRNNTLPVLMYPTVIDKMGKYYNSAHILLEINDVGSEVADILYQELEYENVLLVSNRGKKGQKVDGGFGESGKVQFGVRTSYQIKKLGCSILKEMIEQDKLMVTDLDVISELSTFISKGISHEASEGYHDDLVDTLVLFSWLTTQTYFREIIDIDTRKKLYEKRLQDLEASLSPFGFIEDGIVDFETEKARDASLLSRELPTQRSMDLPPEDVNLEDDSSFFWA